MRQHIDSVEDILSKIKPQKTEINPQNITHIKMYTLNDLIRITILMNTVLIIVFVFIYFFFEKQVEKPTSAGQITYEHTQDFYNMVHRIADCEERDYMNVHAEFRKKYNYAAYRYMPDNLFKKIYFGESHRICEIE